MDNSADLLIINNQTLCALLEIFIRAHTEKQPPKRLLGFDAHGEQKPFKALLAVLVDIPSER